MTTFQATWRAEALKAMPMIAPARQFTYPLQIAGEEDALARGAMYVLVHPAAGATFLATCALGFSSAAMPSGIWACPNPDEICLVAGGYAYVVNTARPESCVHLAMRPVVEVLEASALAEKLLVFAGFHRLMAWGAKGLAWETRRLSWEGLRIERVEGDSLRGFGWNLQTDKEAEFVVDLRTGECVGGGF